MAVLGRANGRGRSAFLQDRNSVATKSRIRGNYPHPATGCTGRADTGNRQVGDVCKSGLICQGGWDCKDCRTASVVKHFAGPKPMSFSWSIFITVLLLGVVQLAVGVVFGRCLPLRSRKTTPPEDPHDAAALEESAARLRQLVARLARDVGTHRTKIRLANQELSAVDRLGAQELTELVLLTVSEVVKLNTQLQSRLAEADRALQRQAAQIELHMAEARTDPLTRLPNRRAFDDRLRGLLARWQDQQTPLSLLMIDVDHFKQLNDRYGHLAGDQALRHIAEVLRATVGDRDLLARVGGEEFAVIAAECSLPGACTLAELLRKAVFESEYRLGGQTVPLSVSIGLTISRPGDDSALLVRRADEALYCAKRSGRNCGYYHDGLGCHRIPQAEQSADDLDALCHQLRNRLAAVCADS